MIKNLFVDEPGNGAETVEIVIGIVCSVGLGAALLVFQGYVLDALESAGESVQAVFSGMAGIGD